MKLKLIALAVAAVASAAASAQTANVTLYGVVDTFIASTRTSDGRNAAGVVVPGARITAIEPGGLSGSRWGIRGSEALGGGLNAVFQLEGGINTDVGTSAQGGLLFGRQAYVGLNGGFGSVTVGRQYAPMFYVLDGSDIDGTSSFSVSGNHQLGRPGTLRINNSINYVTPNMGGVTAALMWGLGESPVSTAAGRMVGANVQYNGGPLYLALAYADVKDVGLAAVAATATTPAVTARGPGSTNRSWTLGGTYDFGVVKLAANYFEEKYPASGAPKFKDWQIGAGVPFGATTLILAAGQGKQGAAKQTLFDIGADYSLSKRTTAYFRYANANNNANSNIDVFVKPAIAATTFGADKSIFALGVRHRF
jgi:predicted porin